MKIMHGSDNDLFVIRSVLKFSFLNFIDTARLEMELKQRHNIRGLASLVGQYLNSFMSKDYQISQWRIRPIPVSMIEYARRDSLVLPALARTLMCSFPWDKLKHALIAGCLQAKKNKKTSQPLVKSIQAI